MADAHGLHSDDEGVGERRQHEQHRRHAAGAEGAPGELYGVRRTRSGIEEQQYRVHEHDYP
jgi:hypothetical protein